MSTTPLSPVPASSSEQQAILGGPSLTAAILSSANRAFAIALRRHLRSLLGPRRTRASAKHQARIAGSLLARASEAIPVVMSDVMTSSPHTVKVDASLAAAHKIMIDHELRHLPVVRDGKLAGVLSQRDLYFLERIGGVDADVDVIGDAMSEDVFETTEDAKLADVARTMAEHKYGCAVVVREGKIVGIFTVTDALRHIAALS